MEDLEDTTTKLLASPGRASDARAARVLVRFSGDLATKARRTRARFAKRLHRNAKDGLRAEGLASQFHRSRDRLIVELPGGGNAEAERAAAVLARIFGVQSVSVVEPRAFGQGDPLGELVAAGEEIFGDAVVGRRFAVRARRVGDRSQIPVDTGELERRLGARLLPRAAGVDLGNPEVAARIEVTAGTAYFYRDTTPGPGGLPLGVEGRAVALVSGGFDSAVAAWQLMRRGVALDFVFCNLGGQSHQLGTLRVMKHVVDAWGQGARCDFHSIDFDPLSRALQRHCDTRMWQIVLKRLLLRAAEAVAHERDAAAIVTGDAMGQVSSQTLPNLAAIGEATSLPILRPLVGSNKEDIIATARAIGTFELSAKVDEYCALVQGKPATAATVAQARAQEERLFHAEPDLLERVIAERTTIDLRRIDLASFDDEGLRTEEIRPGDSVIDLRSKPAHAAWHFPDALYLDFANALRAYPHFDASRRYVLYCEFGVKSAHLAEVMRRQGLDASHFAGGLKGLLRYARERGVATPEI